MGSGIFSDGVPIIDIGASYLGEGTYDIDYTVVGDQVSKELVASPFLNYRSAIRLKPSKNTEVLAGHPAVIRKGNIIYLAHDPDKQYFQEGARIHRDLFINCLNLLRLEPLVEAEMPSMGRINLLKQAHKNRYVLHLLYASPIQRGSVRVVEDLVPSGKKLRLRKSEGKLHVIVPELYCHNALVLEY